MLPARTHLPRPEIPEVAGQEVATVTWPAYISTC